MVLLLQFVLWCQAFAGQTDPMVEAPAPPNDVDVEAALAAEQRRIDVIARVKPAVVCIYDLNSRGGGSGVVVDPHGYGLTNYHVVANLLPARRGYGGLPDGKLYELEVVGIDPTGDVAMFRLHGRERFDFVELADSDQVRVGDRVLAMGNPFMLATDHRPSVTMGIVTGVHRYQRGQGNALVYTDCIQTDAAINPGNSGGPLFDLDGRVIGINGRISAAANVRGRLSVGLGYAISASQIRRFLPGLRAGLLVRHGTMQATVNDTLLFDKILEGGPAWEAGIRPGDRLLRVGRRDIRSANEFASLLGVYPEAWPVTVAYERDGLGKQTTVHLEPLPVDHNGLFPIDPEVTRRAAENTAEEHARNDGRGPAGPFDRAIRSARDRTVKLYGLGAGPQQGYGSGIIVSADGLVLTVLSLLIDARIIRAVTPDGTPYTATVVARDSDRQLALLQLEPEAPTGLRPADLEAFSEGSSASLQPGDWVVAAGNPFKVAEGAEPVSVGLGVLGGRTRLDARRRRQDYPFQGDVLVIDAVTSNPGAPGGPLVNLDGRWVGVVGRTVTSNVTHTRFNHAAPAELCLEFVRGARDQPSLTNEPHPRRLDPGFKLMETGYRKKLVFVERVKPDSPAARAGLKTDDLIVNANGRRVPDLAAFRRVLGKLKPGDSLELIVVRDERHLDIVIALEPEP